MDKYPRSRYLEEQRRVSTDQGYIEDLKRLRELVLEGNFRREKSPKAKEDPKRREEFVRLASKYEEAHMAFGEERRRELLKRCEHSPYLEKMRRGLPDTDENREHLKNLERLRNQMIHMKLGYGCQGLGMMLHSLKTRYPQAHEAFEKEIGNL